MRRAFAVALVLVTAGCALFAPAPPDAERLGDWQHRTVSLRELEFTRPVEMRWVSRKELPAVLKDEAAEELEPARVTRQRDSLAALGALSPDVDLAKELIEVYSSEVSGLYSVKRNTLFVLDELGGLLESALLDPIVVHELTHALQDQNFPRLFELLVELDDQNDLTTALSSVIEGDASVTMLGALPGERAQHSVSFAELMRDQLLGQLDDPDSDVGRAPRLVGLSLVFPYAYGTVAAAHRYVREGNAGLDAALLDPPLASLHVLYPETRGSVDFVRLPLESLAATGGCTLDQDNVAGALVLQVLFEPGRDPAAVRALLEGWRGDRYVRLECGEKWELVWLTRWESLDAAERFADAYRALTPAIAAQTKLSGPAAVVVRDRTALVVTPGLRPRADELLRGAEIRSFANLESWVASGCFPEAECPTKEKSPTRVAGPESP